MARPIEYDEAVNLYKILYGGDEFTRFEQAWANWGATVDTEDIMKVIEGRGDNPGSGTWVADSWVAPSYNSNGNIYGYKSSFDVSYPSASDSNEIVKSRVTTPLNTTTQVVEGRNVMSAKVGLREAGKFAVGSVVPAVAATGIGISLGKTIDSTLYNLAPDFFDEHGMSSLNPATWNTITTKEDGIAGRLFDMIFGIDSDGNTQTYMDEDAVAYLSWWLKEAGVFNTEAFEDIEVTTETDVVDSLVEMTAQEFVVTFIAPNAHSDFSETDLISDFFTNHPQFSPNDVGYLYKSSYYVNWIKPIGTPVYDGGVSSVGNPISNISPTLDIAHNKEIYAYTSGATLATLFSYNTQTISTAFNRIANYTGDYISDHHVIVVGKYSPKEGIGNQPGATLPSTDTWNDLNSTKQSLQQQYPQLWDGAKHQDYVDENGNNKTKTLLPINLPNAKNPFDTQPTSGDRSQTDPLIDPTTATDELIDTITDLITHIPWNNPPTTGGGNSPTTVVPVGKASSLWKIYNPTQAQVDSFGAWLWDSSFVEQIKKLFNDPMQAIIGIHKVFATPSIGGTATIKVGYLDSQVPSDWVDDQYTTINCGTVSLSEYYGNVFDYSPYTKVSLYLPFIGIVDLDVADVMRASINVTYHVDVLSGACLADVKVSRDLANAVLYQYSGSAIVTYPVSSGNYMGMVAGVLSVASGIAGTVLSGGALAPALIGGAVGASHLHTDVSHSGGFSGCAGAMASKKPYLIISRPITSLATNFPHYTGYPANSNVTIKDCSGYIKVKSVYTQNIYRATDVEKDMIEAQLKAGVLV